MDEEHENAIPTFMKRDSIDTPVGDSILGNETGAEKQIADNLHSEIVEINDNDSDVNQWISSKVLKQLESDDDKSVEGDTPTYIDTLEIKQEDMKNIESCKNIEEIGIEEVISCNKEIENQNDSILSALKDIFERLTFLDKKFETKILRSEKEGAIIDNMHEKLQRYENDLYARLLQPILVQIITVREHIMKLSLDLSNLPEGEQNSSLKTFSSFADDLFRILDDNEIEVIHSSVGSEYVPIKQKIVEKRIANDPAEHKTIAAVIGEGYSYRGRPLVAQKVIVFVYEPEVTKETLNEGEETNG